MFAAVLSQWPWWLPLRWPLVVGFKPKNVDLSTVPKRESVQLTIYNSEDLTLVRETRKVSFKKGRQPPAVQLGQHADRPDLGASCGS